MNHRTAVEIESARRMIEGYEALRVVAVDHDMEVEVDRIDRSLAEWKREIIALGGIVDGSPIAHVAA